VNSTININLAAISHNVTVVRSLAPNQEICAVVKANAYNHGLPKITRTLYSQGVRWFSVTNIDEAIKLYSLQLAKVNILIFTSNCISDVETIISHDFVITIHSVDMLEHLANVLKGRTLRCHIEIDTGMSRTGITEKDIPHVSYLLKTFSNIKTVGIYSHYANADYPEDTLNNEQKIKLHTAVEEFIKKEILFTFCHIANSPGIINQFNKLHTNMVRPGIMLYGISPCHCIISLKPVMSWYSKIIQIRSVIKGQGVSYSHTWKAPKESLIAIISAGYADGYPRQASNRGYVIINNQKAEIIGNICMDFMMVDISGCSNISAGDNVILIGNSDSFSISAADIASWANTISYDILCAAGKRANLIYQP